MAMDNSFFLGTRAMKGYFENNVFDQLETEKKQLAYVVRGLNTGNLEAWAVKEYRLAEKRNREEIARLEAYIFDNDLNPNQEV